MTRLTPEQAAEFIESVMDCPIDFRDASRIEAFILDKSVVEVSRAFDDFCLERDLEIDEDSVEFRADKIDICDDDCTQIIIKTEVRHADA